MGSLLPFHCFSIVDVQYTAQAEIDSVVGSARLPCLADREQLPYISAIVTELLRWHSVAPLGGSPSGSPSPGFTVI